MAVTYVDARSQGNSSLSSITVDRPTGVSGDVVVLIANGSTSLGALGSPWTLLDSSVTSLPLNTRVWRAPWEGLGSTITVTQASTAPISVLAISARGAGPVSVLGVNLVESSGSITSITAPSVSPLVAGLLLFVPCYRWGTGGPTPDSASTIAGMTTISNLDTFQGLSAFYESVSAGSTGTRTQSITIDDGVDASAGYNIVLTIPNTAPNAPGPLSPDGTTIDKDVTQRFAFPFSDPDVGDSQSKYDLRYRLVGAGTWTDTTGTTPNQFRDFAGGTFAAGDYEWQARSYDALGFVGPYSASAFFTAASSPSEPTITDPINGGTVNTDPYPVGWSTPEQDAYQVRTVADDGGSPDTGTVYQDTGTVESTSARSQSMVFDTTGRTEHVQVRIRVNGLWSAWASVSVSVAYTAPATPTGVVTATPADGLNNIDITNPTPVGGQPSVTFNRIHARIAAGGRPDLQRTVGGVGIPIGTNIATNGVFDDLAASSGANTEYQIEAVGSNGVSSLSGWI